MGWPFRRKSDPARRSPALPIDVADARAEVDAALATLTAATPALRSAGAPDDTVAKADELLAAAEGPARLLQEGRGLPRDLEELQRLADAAAALVAEFAG